MMQHDKHHAVLCLIIKQHMNAIHANYWIKTKIHLITN